MPHDHRIDHDVITDSTMVVVMDVRTRRFNGGDLDHYLVLARLGLGPVLNAQIAGGVKHRARIWRNPPMAVIRPLTNRLTTCHPGQCAVPIRTTTRGRRRAGPPRCRSDTDGTALGTVAASSSSEFIDTTKELARDHRCELVAAGSSAAICQVPAASAGGPASMSTAAGWVSGFGPVATLSFRGSSRAAASPATPTAARVIIARPYARLGVDVMPAMRIVPAMAAPRKNRDWKYFATALRFRPVDARGNWTARR